MKTDILPKDIIDLVDASTIGRGERYIMADRDILIESLCMYIVERDHKVLAHSKRLSEERL